MVMYTEKLAILCHATYKPETKNATMLHAMRASFDVWKMTTLGRVASFGCIGVGFLYNSSMYYCIGEKGVGNTENKTFC